jgi:hypothetical protein
MEGAIFYLRYSRNMAGNPFFASNKMIEEDASVLGQEYRGLRASPSTDRNGRDPAAVVEDHWSISTARISTA